MPNRLWPCALLLLICTLVVFEPARHFSFVDWDDNIHIYNNPHLQRSEGPDVAAFWRAPYIGLYIPVTFTAWSTLAPSAKSQSETKHALNKQTPSSEYARQFDPRPFHTANWLVHAVNSLLALGILYALFGNAWCALAGAALFALHPNQVEAVAWATALKDLLGGFFSFLALWLYLLFARAREGKKSRANYFFIAATIAFILALLSKPSAVALPLVAGWLHFWLLARREENSTSSLEYSRAHHLSTTDHRPLTTDHRPVFHPLWLWLLPALALAGAMRFFIQNVEKPSLLFPLWQRMFVAGDALAFYIAKMIWPAQFVIVYGRRPDVVLQNWWGYATWILPAALLALAWKLRARAPFLLAGLGVFILSVLPTSGLVPFAFQSYSTVADRYLYPAMLGAAIILAGALAEYSRASFAAPRRRLRPVVFAACALWLAALSFQSRAQLEHWRSDEALWVNLLNYDAHSWVAHNNLGGIQLERGQARRALEHLNQADKARPNEAQILTNLGDAFAALGQSERAMAQYRRAMEIEPKYLKAPIQLATLLQKQGSISGAIKGYRAVLKQAPDSVSANYNLGILLAQSGDNANAIRHFQAALQAKPDDAQIHDALATSLARTDQLPQARAHWQKAALLDPSFADARINLGVLLAMQNQMPQAIALWQEAIRIEPKNAQAHFYLGQAFALQKQNAAAKKHLQIALKLQPDLGAAKKLLRSLR